MQRVQTLQRIAHMQPLNRPPGTFQLAVPRGGKRNHRTVEALFNARSENTDHALMPLRMIHRQPAGQLGAAALKLLAQRQRFRLHPLLYFFTGLV